LPEVRESAEPVDGQRDQVGSGEGTALRQSKQPLPRREYFRFATRGLTYLLALAVMATASVWVADRLSRPGLPVVAVLPITAEPEYSELALLVENELNERLMELGDVELLSRSAVASRPANPFPFFFYEFGARWVIEAELRHLSSRDVLMLAVVDARTGIVLTQQSEPIGSASDGVADSIANSLQALAPLIGSESPEIR
jgi:hypothetical protein